MANQPKITVRAVLLDQEDGEGGIVETLSGKVLGRFPSVRSAAQTLRHWRPKYEAIAFARVRGVTNLV
jgi:hypothetical protein